MKSQTRLGAIDFSPVPEGANPTDVLARTIETGQILQDLGYESLWFGEHHSPRVAHSCPEILVSAVAAKTERLRVGAAGVLLRYHAPLRIACAFRLLGAIYSNRIDLGIARGGVERARERLFQSSDCDEAQFASRVAELLSYLRQTADIPVSPLNVPSPPVWMLGSARESARIAAMNGTSFCFAAFLAADSVTPESVLADYRNHFIPSSTLSSPQCAIAIAGSCARTAQHNEERVESGDPIIIRNKMLQPPEHFRNYVDSMKRSCNVDYFTFLDTSYDRKSRLKSYELLADCVR